jgi:hypothetical protein
MVSPKSERRCQLNGPCLTLPVSKLQTAWSLLRAPRTALRAPRSAHRAVGLRAPRSALASGVFV